MRANRITEAVAAEKAMTRKWAAVEDMLDSHAEAIARRLDLPDEQIVRIRCLTRCAVVEASIAVAGPWSAVRAEARRIAAGLGVSRWTRSPRFC